MRGPQAHALLLPLPAQSHINPMMHFGRILSAHYNIKVTFAITQSNYAHILCHTSTIHSASLGNFNLVSVFDGTPEGSPVPSGRDLMYATDKMEIGVQQLIQQLVEQGNPPSCIIADMFLPWGAHLSKALDTPYFAFSVMTASCYAAFLYMPLDIHISKARNELPKDSLPITILPNTPAVNPFSELPTHVPYCTESENIQVLNFLRHSSRTAIRVLVNSIDEMEAATVAALRREGVPVLTVGPSVPYSILGIDNPVGTEYAPSLWREEDDCLKWLDRKRDRSVVYVSFGTVAELSNHETREVALGLENSEQPFLWVIRPSSEKAESIADVLPEGFLDRTKDRALFVKWAPQLRVLAHPSVGCFFFQFGWSSCMESLSMGIPMMGWPVWMDNPVNCRLLTKEWRVAMECMKRDDGTVDKAEVERVVRAMMVSKEGEEMRRKANLLRDMLRAAVREGGSTYVNMMRLADDIYDNHSEPFQNSVDMH